MDNQQFWHIAITSAIVGAIPAIKSVVHESRAKRSREGRDPFLYEVAHRLGTRWAAYKRRLRRPLS